jgi:hypothetical protein
MTKGLEFHWEGCAIASGHEMRRPRASISAESICTPHNKHAWHVNYRKSTCLRFDLRTVSSGS